MSRQAPIVLFTLAFLFAAALASPTLARAEIGALDNVPAATLLLPYFEVDLDDPNGPQARFTVNNIDSQPTIAKVTFWSNVGVPVLNFNLYLGGYDSVEVDLRLAFQGILPQTGPSQHEAGEYSDLPLLYPQCDSILPAPDRFSTTLIQHVRAALSAEPSPLDGQCYGLPAANHDLATGYVTIDVVNECSVGFPTDPGYFAHGGNGIASNDNRLFGDYTMIDRGRDETSAAPLVAIEASSSDPITSGQGAYTFYGTIVGGSAVDNREPLGTVWNARYVNGGVTEADLIVWRDPGQVVSPFDCASAPPTVPYFQQNIVSFDEQETGVILSQSALPLPYATQRVPVEALSPFDFGFLQLNLNSPTQDLSGLRQSYVIVRHNAVLGALTPATRLFGPQHQPAGPQSCDNSTLCALVPVVIE